MFEPKLALMHATCNTWQVLALRASITYAFRVRAALTVRARKVVVCNALVRAYLPSTLHSVRSASAGYTDS